MRVRIVNNSIILFVLLFSTLSCDNKKTVKWEIKIDREIITDSFGGYVNLFYTNYHPSHNTYNPQSMFTLSVILDGTKAEIEKSMDIFDLKFCINYKGEEEQFELNGMFPFEISRDNPNNYDIALCLDNLKSKGLLKKYLNSFGENNNKTRIKAEFKDIIENCELYVFNKNGSKIKMGYTSQTHFSILLFSKDMIVIE